ncbi:MAG: dynamin family protein [Lautropia sp.]|nr:dynamin family protein [Lautropia sp.]
MSLISERIVAYGRWRSELLDAVQRYRSWLAQSELADPTLQARLQGIMDRLRDDRMSVAFVAEFSRGKSELINALFFAQYGQRVVPSTAGRTTMCPTELLYDANRPVGIRLLPIETRLEDVSIADVKRDESKWQFVAVDPADVTSLRAAFEAVRATRRIPSDRAALMGMYDESDDGSPYQPDAEGMVEVPSWRHAIVNIPHPLLELGLVIIDTPGLNAIGAEPELTLNLIPSAQAVLFVLAADAGVTRTDIDIWREHISPAHRSGRFVVLNKIDGLWDELKSESEINLEIASQVASVGRLLDLPTARIYPVSAQKALVGKIQGDDKLLRRSRLPELEHALSEEVIPQQQAIVRDQVRREFEETTGVTLGVLSARQRNQIEQAFELNGLRGKNKTVIDQMSRRIRAERADFEKSLRQLQALRTVFSRHSQTLFSHIGLDNLRRHVRDSRDLMRASHLSTQLRDGMSNLLAAVRIDFEEGDKLVREVTTMMTAMYRSFSSEYGLTLGTPLPFSSRRYFAEIDRISQLHQRQFGLISLLTVNKSALTRRFFESVVARLKELYQAAVREIEGWLRALMSPVESQVKEHQAQLRRRLESVQRVMDASESLDSKLLELDESKARIDQQLAILQELVHQVGSVMDRRVAPVKEAELV